MSKERLEEIAYHVGISLDGDKALMSSDDYDFLYNYAKEQAERVQELENILDQDHRQEVLERMYEQNKRYRNAIEETLQAMGMVDRQKYGKTLERVLEVEE